jgi:hypothetical protein
LRMQAPIVAACLLFGISFSLVLCTVLVHSRYHLTEILINLAYQTFS